MQTRVAFIQSMLSDLSTGLENDEKEKIVHSIKNIKAVCEDIEREIFEDEETLKKDSENIVEDKYEMINEITFLYKPITVVNIYEGEYLERFSEQRTVQLQGANAIKAHNDFWQQHITVRGNIYGSVPSELLSEESSRKLIEYGWKPVAVKIYDISKTIEDERVFYNYCDKNYRNHILLKEKETDGLLVLKYEL